MKFIIVVIMISVSMAADGDKKFASDLKQLYPFQKYDGDIYKFYIVNWLQFVNQTKINTNEMLNLIESSISGDNDDVDKKQFNGAKVKLENLQRKIVNEHNKVFLNGLTELTKSLRRIHSERVNVCNLMEINREKCLKLNDFCKLESIEDGLVQCVKSLLLENFNGLLEYTFALASFYDEYSTGNVDDSILVEYYNEVKSTAGITLTNLRECTVEEVKNDQQLLQRIQFEEKSCFQRT